MNARCQALTLIHENQNSMNDLSSYLAAKKGILGKGVGSDTRKTSVLATPKSKSNRLDIATDEDYSFGTSFWTDSKEISIEDSPELALRSSSRQSSNSNWSPQRSDARALGAFTYETNESIETLKEDSVANLLRRFGSTRSQMASVSNLSAIAAQPNAHYTSKNETEIKPIVYASPDNDHFAKLLRSIELHESNHSQTIAILTSKVDSILMNQPSSTNKILDTLKSIEVKQTIQGNIL